VFFADDAQGFMGHGVVSGQGKADRPVGEWCRDYGGARRPGV
jgi:hypothetical protein